MFLSQGITAPREPWYWPKDDGDDEEDPVEEEDEEEEIPELNVGIYFRIKSQCYHMKYMLHTNVINAFAVKFTIILPSAVLVSLTAL